MLSNTATVARVNAMLKARGAKATLRRGRGYYYFTGDDTRGWHETIVCTYRVESLTLQMWMDEYDRLANSPDNH